MDPHAQELIARLRRNPDDGEAYGTLRAHYHRLGDYASLANLLEGWAARSADDIAAAAAFFEAAELCEGYLDDRPRAISLFERALDRYPIHIESSTRLEELFESVGDYRRLTDVLERRANALQAAGADPRHIAVVHQQIGEVWEQRLSRVDRAITHYRKAFELDPNLVSAIYAAREIYRTAGNLKAASSLYDLEVQAESDPRRKVALLREVAHLRGELMNDLAGAVAALERAQTQAPTDLSVMHDLASALLKRADRQESADVARRDREKAADLLYRMAQSVPPDHALPYAEAALDAAPDHDGVLELLEKLAADLGREDILPIRWVGYLSAAPTSPTSDKIRRRLGAAYVEAGQVDDAIACYEPLLDRSDAEAAEALVELYRQVGRQRDVVRALSVSVAGLPVAKRIPRLLETVRILRDQGALDEARERAKEILALDPGEEETLTFLEKDCRDRSAFEELRDLLLAAGRVPEVPVDVRKARLREVARLSRDELDDLSGAVSALRAVTSLDPADIEARRELAVLLEATERWDELVQLLERDALTVTEPEEKAEIYRRLAHIHRDRRKSLAEAIEAYRSLREIRPGDDEARDELSDVLVDAGAYIEAVPLLRQRIDAAPSTEQRVELLARLAELLHERLGDEEGAFEVATRLLDENPKSFAALDRMEAIDIEAERWYRLVETLSYRAEITPEKERSDVFIRIAKLADEKLGDLSRASECYAKALDLDPGSIPALDAICDVYDRAERFRDLVVLLRQRAKHEEDAVARAELYRRIARTLAERVRNEDAAAEAWHEVLSTGEDREALEYLVVLARKRDDPSELAGFLGRLAALVDTEVEKRDLLLERAELLADHLGDRKAAIAALTEIVERLDPEHVAALTKLAELCEKEGDVKGLANALERTLMNTADDGLRMPIARRLADLYEGELDDGPRAVDALRAWADTDLMDPEPQRRLVERLAKLARHEDLLAALDSLAGIEQEDARASEIVRRAARLCIDELGDVDGAWSRLAERVEEGDQACEEALRNLARDVARGEALAELYVNLAQRGDSPEDSRKRWLDASNVLETYLDDPSRALEATLRAFAVDLDDTTLLDEVDRLAGAANAWERLGQVYDTLTRKAGSDASKIAILLRHATLLDEKAKDPSAALDRVLRAAALAPDDDHILVVAEELAPRANRAEELLIVYDRRRVRAVDEAGRVEAVLRAARLTDVALRDRDRAFGFIAQAVVATGRAPALLDVIEAAVRELDEARPDLGAFAARRSLTEVYRLLAEKVAEDAPETGGEMLRRAGRVFVDELGDREGGYRYLEQAAALSPSSGRILDELEQLAEQMDRFSALEKHLERLVKEALDQSTAADLLKRRGRILEIELERFSDAADVWSRLFALRKHDPEVPPRLRHCLRKAGRTQDLLLVLDRELEAARDVERQVEILKSIAHTWADDLNNKWEASDAWKRVLALAPDDEEAAEAVRALGKVSRRPASLLDEDTGERTEPIEPATRPRTGEDATSPALMTPSAPPDAGGSGAATFEDDTDLESADDFLAATSATDQRAVEAALAFASDAPPAPAAPEALLRPGTGAAAFGSEEHTAPSYEDTPIKELTSELDISDVDASRAALGADEPTLSEPKVEAAAPGPELETIDEEPELFREISDAGDVVDMDDDDVMRVDTGEVSIESLDTGDVMIDDADIEDEEDEELEELDAVELLEPTPPPPRKTSAPPPPPPKTSAPPPPPKTSAPPPPPPKAKGRKR